MFVIKPKNSFPICNRNMNVKCALYTLCVAFGKESR